MQQQVLLLELTKNKFISRILLVIGICIIVFNIVIVINTNFKNNKQEFAHESFLLFLDRAVSYYENYYDTGEVVLYYNFVINYSAAVDSYEIYYLEQNDRSNREYLALDAIRDDLVSNISQPRAYAKNLCDILNKFDENYEYGSDSYFIEIYNIAVPFIYD